jgi:hypothetical protein
VNLEEAYEELETDDYLCLEVYNAKFVGIAWYDSQNQIYVINVRFGSGRHRTIAGMDKEKTLNQWRELAEQSPEKAGANLVSKHGNTEVEVIP